MVAHSWNLSIPGAEAGRSPGVQDNLGYIRGSYLKKTKPNKKKLDLASGLSLPVALSLCYTLHPSSFGFTFLGRGREGVTLENTLPGVQNGSPV